MKKNICIFLIILATFLVQSSMNLLLPDILSIPNLILILTCSMGFMRGKKSGMWVGFFSGIF